MSKPPLDRRILPGLSNYAIREDGVILGGRGKQNYRCRPLVGSRDKDGYVRFTLIGDDGKRVYWRRCSLVCTAFHGPKPSPLHEVRHIDGRRDNDAASNLAWSDHRTNCGDKWSHGTVQIGQDNPHAVLKDFEARFFLEHSDIPVPILTEWTGLSAAAIHQVRQRHSWKWLDQEGYPETPELRRHHDLYRGASQPPDKCPECRMPLFVAAPPAPEQGVMM